ncbi:protein translocase subunit SecF [archaeon]|jgi:preprotein translocase subunit SecF|nr:protein translocase subunit SecF [archaeon]
MEQKKTWYDKHYKTLLLIPLILIIFSIAYLAVFNAQTGDFFRKDISLAGGTEVTIYDENLNMEELENSLSDKLPELDTRKISYITTGTQKGVVVKTTENLDNTKKILEEFLGYELISGEKEKSNSDIRTENSSFSEGFYKQLLIAILIAFIFMAIVVFIIFKKTIIPSVAVLISAFADILMTLVLVNILGIKLSTAGIVALIMLIGYSVDTDIMLTNRVLKRQNEGTLNKRIYDSFKTGMTMTLSSFFAMLIALVVVQSFSPILTQIFTILVIGLGFDILNTWITNVSILKWYMERKK